jgi:hypothetical protein
MAALPTGFVNQEKLANEIERARKKLGPEVVRLKHTVGPNTSDEPAIYFRIVLTDSASREETLGDVIGQISRVLFDELHPYENWGLKPYLSFRSQSEQANRDDPAWA